MPIEVINTFLIFCNLVLSSAIFIYLGFTGR